MVYRVEAGPAGRCGAPAPPPLFVDSDAAKGVNAGYELAIYGGPWVVALFHDGIASVTWDKDEPIHCRLSGDPVAWLLALYGRAGWEELMRQGRVTVTDGDAALGVRFKRLLRNPSPAAVTCGGSYLRDQEIGEFLCGVGVELFVTVTGNQGKSLANGGDADSDTTGGVTWRGEPQLR